MKTILNSDFHMMWGYTPLEHSVLAPDGLMIRLKGKPQYRALSLRYNGVGIALFRPEMNIIKVVDGVTLKEPIVEFLETDKEVKKRAEEWIKTYGYQAEWIRAKYMAGGVYQNWTDDMLVSPVWTESILMHFKSRKEATDFYWTPEYLDIVHNQYKGPRYSAFLHETKLLVIDHFPNQK